MAYSEIEFDEAADATGAAYPGPLIDFIGAVERAGPGAVGRLSSDNVQSRNAVLETVAQGDSDELSVEMR